MGQALYRKYRSKSLSEIVGQEHITDTLSRALASGRISHAYLFSGPRGVGKTSIARILAHEINGLTYIDDRTHMDIIEIDAASNNSVEDVRDLREKVYVAPSSAKYKVYIIDEVHMLSKAAFNALLKTLEEPPAHVVFILATTLANKLPDTIISRTQHYTFKPVGQAKVIEHLRFIAGKESVQIDDEALALLAAHGEGSFRDSISLLDQARGLGSLSEGAAQISGADVRQLLGIAPDTAIKNLIAAVATPGQAGKLLAEIDGLYGQGLQAAAIASQIGEALRSALAKNKPLLLATGSLSLMKALIEVPASRSPERLLEIVLLEAADTSGMVAGPPAATAVVVPAGASAVAVATATVTAAPAQEPVAQSTPSKPATKAAKVEADTPSAAVSRSVEGTPEQPLEAAEAQAVVVDVAVTTAVTTAASAVALDATVWPRVLDSLKKEYNTLYGVLRMANPVFSADGVELQMKFAFHQKRLNEVKNKQIIANFIKQVTGSDFIVTCTYAKDSTTGKGVIGAGSSTTPTSTPSGDSAVAMAAINNIFGGAEILGS